VLLIGTYIVFGIGFGMINAPITTTAVSGMPLSQAGVAAGLASTSRQTGSSVGVAIAGTVTGVGAASAIGPAFAGATHPLWWIVFGSGLAVAAIGVVSTSRWAHGTAQRVRHLLEEAPVTTGSLRVARSVGAAATGPATGGTEPGTR
jgi:MFS family permease